VKEAFNRQKNSKLPTVFSHAFMYLQRMYKSKKHNTRDREPKKNKVLRRERKKRLAFEASKTNPTPHLFYFYISIITSSTSQFNPPSIFSFFNGHGAFTSLHPHFLCFYSSSLKFSSGVLFFLLYIAREP
jgi:hypothetical protein